MNTLSDDLLSVSGTDWITAIIAFFIIFVLLLLTEFTGKKFNISSFFTRKFIHIATGCIICIVAYLITSNIPILIFASLYILIDFWAIKAGKFKSIHPGSLSLGTVFYAISVLTLAIIFWGEYKPLFIITNLIMIIPDAMAAIVGEKFANNFFIPLREKKSIIGSVTMFFLTALIVSVSLMAFYDLPVLENLLFAVIVAVIATVSEILSIRGSDNLSVPLFSGLFLYVLLYMSDPSLINNIAFSALASGFIAIISYRFRFLDTGGAMITFLMGVIIFGLGGWACTLPILTFFILSSLLSKLGKAKKKTIEISYQKTGIRDFYQVIANGGVAAILVIIMFLTKIDELFPVYLAAVAAATADTWGTELGIFSRKNPVLITSFKRVGPGTSGAVSMVGTSAAFTGSMIIVLIGSLFYEFNFAMFFIVILAGFAGSFFDSILGATVQGHFHCKICNHNTESKEHCGQKSEWLKGKKWLDNDLVNIFSISFAVILSIIFI